MRVLGIDPGAHGAIALFRDGVFVSVRDMPTIEDKGRPRVDGAALGSIIRGYAPTRAVLERVGARPGQGVTSMFQFGRAVGIVEGALGALLVPVTHVTPVQWKGALRVPADKGAMRRRASELVPSAAHHWPRAKDHGRAEAVLIAFYGIGIEEKSIVW
jgi:crossover junction endodeoxyribonuclease RuvC